MGRILLLILACSTAVVTQAADPQRGVLPDGRAYRTDQSGNQLVDYIAELEVTRDGLEQRIFTLQEQLKAREHEVQLLRSGANPPAAAPVCPTCPNVDSQTAELKRIKEELDKARSTVTQLEGTVHARDTELLNARAQSSILHEQVAKIQAPAESMRGSYSTAPTSSERSRALTEARARLMEEISSLQSLKSARDASFARVEQHGKPLQVKPAAVRSQRGYTLEKIAQELTDAQSFRTISELQQDLKEIRKILEDDRALAQRLSKNN